MTDSGQRSSSYGVLVKTGSWKEIVSVSENIESILSHLCTEDISGDVPDEEQELRENELESLIERWKEWRPHNKDKFSKEMRDKTAEQSSIGEASLEKEDKDATDEVEEAGNSIKKAVEETQRGKLDKAGKELTDAVERAGRAVDSKVRPGLRKIEEKTYEIILKMNSLYFDTDLLGAILSRHWGKGSEKRYELDVNINNPRLRKTLVDKVDWDASD